MQELEKTRKELEEGITKANNGNAYISKLPSKGLTKKEVLEKVDTYMKMNTITWKGNFLFYLILSTVSILTDDFIIRWSSIRMCIWSRR